MASYRDSRTKPSAAQQVFGKEYVPALCDCIYERYGASYSTYDNNRNAWRANVAYSVKLEEELILYTKTFIRTMCKDNSRSTNPGFLQAFVKSVADYLSAYTMRSKRYETRRNAMLALQKILWDDFSYIQNLLAAQALKRSARRLRNEAYMSNDWAAIQAYKKAKASQRRLVSGQAPKQK
ncbi:hypothetical protein HDR61_00255 [bacterium]|nr:hypothetical protein [bacterium]